MSDNALNTNDLPARPKDIDASSAEKMTGGVAARAATVTPSATTPTAINSGTNTNASGATTLTAAKTKP